MSALEKHVTRSILNSVVDPEFPDWAVEVATFITDVGFGVGFSVGFSIGNPPIQTNRHKLKK